MVIVKIFLLAKHKKKGGKYKILSEEQAYTFFFFFKEIDIGFKFMRISDRRRSKRNLSFVVEFKFR